MDDPLRHEMTLYTELREKRNNPVTFISPGVAALGRDKVDRLVEAISIFDDFNMATCAHAQHFCDAFVTDEFIVWFRIDYFDEDLKVLSSDPSNPEKTRRAISLKLFFEGWEWSSVVRNA
jgi:hypothetical protein